MAAYCARYRVPYVAGAVPPFPTGQRETLQHREWLKIYKSHNRMGRRQRAQCERCSAPVSEGSVFCEAHRAHNSARTGTHGASAEHRRHLLDSQGGQCPICLKPVDIWDSVDHCHESGEHRGILHQACNQLAGAAERLGPEALHRVREYLWGSRRRRGR